MGMRHCPANGSNAGLRSKLRTTRPIKSGWEIVLRYLCGLPAAVKGARHCRSQNGKVCLCGAGMKPRPKPPSVPYPKADRDPDLLTRSCEWKYTNSCPGPSALVTDRWSRIAKLMKKCCSEKARSLAGSGAGRADRHLKLQTLHRLPDCQLLHDSAAHLNVNHYYSARKARSLAAMLSSRANAQERSGGLDQ